MFSICKTNDESKFITGMIATSKQLYCKIEDHENSKNHLNATESYAMRIKDKYINSLLFTDLLTKRTEEVKYRRIIFERVVDVIKVIRKRGISFRGEFEAAKHLVDPNVSRGNFLDVLLLVAEYVVPLNNHIQSVISKSKRTQTAGRGQHITLISKTTVNYIITSICRLIKNYINLGLKSAGMFSIQIDTTQDVTVTDICSVIVNMFHQLSIQSPS